MYRTPQKPQSGNGNYMGLKIPPYCEVRYNHGMADDAQYKIERIEQDISYLSESLGPRPHGSNEARLASLYVRDELINAGWEPNHVHLQENIVACKGNGQMLFLAHSDSVENSPGVIDNAVGVGILLEIARTLPEPNLCLAFPAAEELGLVGSQHLSGLINKWHPQPDALKLVVALDLTGYGELSVTGLGPQWGTKNLSWLYNIVQPDSPYAYQVVSRSLPHMERSDHAPFAADGILSFQLLGRGPSGIFPAYHQPNDLLYSTAAIDDTTQTLLSLSKAQEPMPAQSHHLDAALVLGHTILPGTLVWGCIVMGMVVGTTQIRKVKRILPLLGWGIGAATFASIPIIALTQFNLFDAPEAELTAQAVMGISATGWWFGSTWVSIASAIFWIGLRQKRGLRAPSSLLCAIYTVLALFIDPLFALPFAISAILSRFWAPAALIPTAYWLQPSILRELSFHGLLPPMMWGIFWLMAIPAFAIGNTEKNNEK